MSAGAREFVSQVLELAVADSARAWLTVAFDADAEVHNATAVAGAYPLVAVCRYGRGDLADGRLTGRWPTVLGAAYADWVLLPAHEATRDGTGCRVLISREDAGVDGATGESAAGAIDVTISDLSVEHACVFAAEENTGIVRGVAGVAAVVVGTAEGMLQQHIRQLRTQLAVSSSAAAVTETDAAHIARAASDIDAARLQITGIPDSRGNVGVAVGASRQAVARARAAADRLLEHSRHALDAANPATRRWRDVDAGSRLAVRMLDGLGTPLG